MNIELHTIGELLILFALAANVLYGFGFYRLARGKKSYEYLAFRSYYLFAGFTIAASAFLYYLLFSHNYLFSYVYDYNELNQPLEYIVSAFWGGQEGTYLLWALMNAAFGFILLKRAGPYRNWAMVVYSGINVFFLVIMIKLSPFAMNEFWATDGMGLNPLLRDYWMVIHPPVIFMGYSMAAVPFSIAIAALITGDFSQWVRRVFPWVAITSVCLAAGNILGGYWAYKTLGWGGYWAWDPVENSSFIPWMASLALLHGLTIEKRTGALRRTNLMLTAFVYLLVVYGTYLTRSGVLSDFSVHSFADLGTNIYLVLFMLISLGFTLTVAAFQMRKVETKPLNYNYYGKEFVLFAGVVTLFIMTVVVLFWTSLPIVTTYFSDTPRAAERETYNQFALPLAIVMSLLLTLSPLSRWGGYKLVDWQKKLSIIALASVVTGFGLFYIVFDATLVFAGVFAMVVTGLVMYLYNQKVITAAIPGLIAFISAIVTCLILGVDNYLYVLFFATASMAAAANLADLIRYLPGQWRIAGAQMTHFGFGLLLVGILASSGFVSSEKLVVPEGSEEEVFETKIAYLGMVDDIETPNNGIRLSLDKNGVVTDGLAELYYSKRMDGIMRKPYIERSLTNDLYLAPATIQQPRRAEAVLQKGQTKQFDNFTVTFKEFEMGAHGAETSGGMTIVAHLSINTESGPTEVSPVFEYTDKYGEQTMSGQPKKFTVEGRELDITVEAVYADQGAVALSVGGLNDEPEVDLLVLDVTYIPLINLVWLGTTLMLLGILIAFVRRRAEVIAVDKQQQK